MNTVERMGETQRALARQLDSLQLRTFEKRLLQRKVGSLDRSLFLEIGIAAEAMVEHIVNVAPIVTENGGRAAPWACLSTAATLALAAVDDRIAELHEESTRLTTHQALAAETARAKASRFNGDEEPRSSR